MTSFAYADFEATLHQCSGCGYTTFLKSHVTDHISRKCPSSTVHSQRCTLTPRPPSSPTHSNTGANGIGTNTGTSTGGANTGGIGANTGGIGANTGTNNGTNNGGANSGTNNGNVAGIINNYTINNYTIAFPSDVVYHGSREETEAACRLLFSKEFAEALREREEQDPDHRESLSSLLFRMLKAGDDAAPQLKNLVVTDDKVYTLVGPGKLDSAPRRQYVKKAVGDMHHVIDYVAKVPHKHDLNQAKREIEAPAFRVGKKTRVAARDVARMQARGDPEMYRLDDAGKRYIEKTRAEQDAHLESLRADRMAVDAAVTAARAAEAVAAEAVSAADPTAPAAADLAAPHV